jgi:hypothetical protein
MALSSQRSKMKNFGARNYPYLGLSAGAIGMALIFVGFAYHQPVPLVLGGAGVAVMLFAPEIFAPGTFQEMWLNLRLKRLVRRRLETAQREALILTCQTLAVALWKKPSKYEVMVLPVGELPLDKMDSGLSCLVECEMYVLLRKWFALGSSTLYRSAVHVRLGKTSNGERGLIWKELRSGEFSSEDATALAERNRRVRQLLRELRSGTYEDTA